MDHKRGVLLGCAGLFVLFLLCAGGLLTGLGLMKYGSQNGARDATHRTSSVRTLPPATGQPPETRPATQPKATQPAYQANAKQVPPEDELRKLITATILDFDKAARAKDVKLLLPRLVASQQRPEDATRLKGVLKNFEDRPPVEFATVGMVAPTYDLPAVLNKEGEFTVGGYFPTKPTRVNFTFTYHFENGDWKLGAWKLGTTLP